MSLNNLLHFIRYALVVLFTRGATYLLTPVVLGYHGIEEYGRYILIMTVSQFLMPVVFFSLPTTTLVLASEDESRIKPLFSNILIFALTAYILFSLMFWSFGSWIFLSITLSVSLGLFDSLGALFKSQSKSMRYLGASVVRVSLLALLLVFLPSLEKAVFFYSLGLIIACIVANVIFVKAPLLFEKKSFTRQLKMGLELVPHSAGRWVMNSSDKYLASNFVTDIQLGLYSLGYTYGSFVSLFNMSVSHFLPQVLYKLKNKVSMNKEITIVLMAYLIVCPVVFLFTKIAYSYDLFGEVSNKESLKSIIWPVSLGLFLNGLTIPLLSIHFKNKRNRLISKMGVLAAICCLIFTFILLIYYDWNALGLATLFTYIIYLTIVSSVTFRYLSKVNIILVFANVLCATIISWLVFS